MRVLRNIKTRTRRGIERIEANEYNRNYRQIDAMYHSDFSIEEIIREMRHLQPYEVIDIIQTIYGKEQVRKEKARAEAAQRYRQQNSYSYRNNNYRYNNRGGRYDNRY